MSLRRVVRTASFMALVSLGVAVGCGGTGGNDEVATNEGGAGQGTSGSSSSKGGSSQGGTAAGSSAAGSGTAGTGFAGSGTAGSATAGSGTAGGTTGGAGGASAGGSSGGKAGAGGQCQVSAGAAGTTGGKKCGSSEICGNGFDDDCNGFIDEGCGCTLGKTQPCYAGNPAEVGKGVCKAGTQTCEGTAEFHGWGVCKNAAYGSIEVCEGKLDENCDGNVDENCGCCPGTVEACGTMVGACKPGKRTCLPSGVFGPCEGGVQPAAKEVCGNMIDDNCDGKVDEGCVIEVAVNIDGDCVCAPPCPPQAPYPVGCKVTFTGGDSRGCVAVANSQVYFQEGDACGAGHVSGQLFCSSEKGAGLNAQNCPINKSKPTYGAKPSDCTGIGSGSPDKCYF